MALAGAGAADQHGVALGGEEAALVQLAHQALIDRRDREVELGQALHHRETGDTDPVGDRAGPVVGELGEQQFPENALNRMLGAQSRGDHLVVSGAHPGQLELAQQAMISCRSTVGLFGPRTAQLVIASAIGDRLDRQR